MYIHCYYLYVTFKSFNKDVQFFLYYSFTFNGVSKTQKYIREMYCSSTFVHWWKSFGFD